jgi:hypothetical protein
MKLTMNEDKYKYFKIAKELNEKHHELLVEKKLHFRGNINSCSLVSLSQDSAEKGKANLKVKELNNIEHLIKTISIEKNPANKGEKELQAWIILEAIKNEMVLPFGNGEIKFITSELVIPFKNEYLLLDKKRDVRNDILGIDSENNLCIIELKNLRVNTVKKQTIEFEKIVNFEIEFFSELVLILTGKVWNGKIRKISIWPRLNGENNKTIQYPTVEEINYKPIEGNFFFE